MGQLWEEREARVREGSGGVMRSGKGGEVKVGR